tara:strand:- start:7029 stop:8051 length:1023 start_codon:yes stop_codon:yes gene_type:complete
MYFLIYTLILVLLLNYFLINKKILFNSTGSYHQNFVSDGNIPLSGGLVLILLIYFYLNNINYYLYVAFFLIFLLGFFSDIKKINSPSLRLILQLIIIFFSVYISSIFVSYTRIDFLDLLLKEKIFQIIFTTFCVLIIVNGSNFIDGVNSLNIGYFLIILFVIFNLNSHGVNTGSYLNLSNLFQILLILFLFNLFNKLYLGDSGSYLLGLLFSLFLIEIHQTNSNISPFFIISLLWYPAFENLFSILRKIRFSKSPINPDTNHLHQLIFYTLRKKYHIEKKYLNSLSGVLINFYNFFSLILAMQFYYDSQIQVIIILFNIIIYVFIYVKLLSNKIKKFKNS